MTDFSRIITSAPVNAQAARQMGRCEYQIKLREGYPKGASQ